MQRILARAALVLAASLAAVPVMAGDLVRNVRLSDLEIVSGKLAPDPGDDRPTQPFSRAQALARSPYVFLNGPGEAYLATWEVEVQQPQNWMRTNRLEDLGLFVRCPDSVSEVEGTLYRPDAANERMEPVRFKLNLAKATDHSASRFEAARAESYADLLDRDLPGAAWFRHQERQARLAAGHPAGAQIRFRRATAPRDSLERSLEFFAGSRAVRENLQLDRDINDPAGQPAPAGAAPAGGVAIDSITGITVAEIDWQPLIEGKSPTLDPLASAIPADQHAVFFPNLAAVGDLVGALEKRGNIPALRLSPGSTENAGLMARYQRELGLGFADLPALAELGVVKSVALTGSDPYFEEGTDVALLFESDAPGRLVEFLKARHQTLAQNEPGAVRERSDPTGVARFSVVLGDGSVQSHAAVLGPTVAVTNSEAQLDRLVAVHLKKSQSLAELPEFTYFRDRYTRAEGAETAFVVLSDATIRRWCGPRWRIAASRRARAGAWLAELQTRYVKNVVDGQPVAGIEPPGDDAEPLGQLAWHTTGVSSSLYGRPARLKPLIEVPIDSVSLSEAAAYERWRDGYQRYFRGVFDPIAIRLSTQANQLSVDLTVMPLIAASDYAPIIQLAGASRMKPTAGDPHPEALFQAILSLDKNAALFRQGNLLSSSMFPGATGGLSWVGETISVAIDDDPIWLKLAQAKSPSRFLNDNIAQLPVGIHVDVADAVRLTLFLGGLRAFLQQSAPDALTWSTQEHAGKSYALITARTGLPDAQDMKIFYATTGGSLYVTLSQSMIERFLDRQAGKGNEAATTTWLGESVSARATARGLRALNDMSGTSFDEELQLRSWNNLPILNEWHRLFPDRDPVAVHRALWGVTLDCPGGGQYVWNESLHTMESTVYGSPALPKATDRKLHPLEGIERIDMGVTFQDSGLRGKLQLDWSKAP